MSLDAAVRRLSPHKRELPPRALLSADEASRALGMPIWQIANVRPVTIGKKVYRYRARDLGAVHPKAKDSTVPELSYRWGVSAGVIRRMINAKELETQRGTRPIVVKAHSIRKKEKARA